jgi:hypothetical protein
MTHLGSHLALDLSQIIGGGAVGGAAMTTAATALASSPTYLKNRARVAALTQLGYKGVDFYDDYQPVLFITGLVGTVVGGAALAKRRKNPEAVALYTITTVASALLAWIARPAALRPAPAEVPAGASTNPAVLGSTLGWLDRRADHLTQNDPGWESRTLARLLGDLGAGTMDPATTALISRNAH